MTVDIAKISRELAKDLIEEARAIMASDVGINSKTGSNTLVDSNLYKQIEYRIQENGETLALDLLFNHYIVFVEWTRPKEHGKRPPINVIIDWMKRKNIAPTNGNIKSAAYAISYSIWKNGYKGRPILDKLFEKSETLWDEKYSQQLFETIIKDIEQFFD